MFLAIPLFLCLLFSHNHARNCDIRSWVSRISRPVCFLPIICVGACLRTSLSVESDNEKMLGSFLCLIMCSSWLTFSTSTITYYDATRQRSYCTVEEVKQKIFGSSSNLNFASPLAGMVVKCSWVSPAAESVESLPS